MNDIAVLSGLSKGLRTATGPTGNSAPGAFLKLAKYGEWLYGANATKAESTSVWACNPFSARKGYVAWEQRKVAGEKMVPVSAPDVDVHALQAGLDWSYQLGIDMVCVSGPDNGASVSYSATSRGGRVALDKLFNEIADKVDAGDPSVVPLIHLLVDSYEHPQYGKIFTPILEITDWREIEDTSPVEEEEEPPKRSRVRA